MNAGFDCIRIVFNNKVSLQFTSRDYFRISSILQIVISWKSGLVYFDIFQRSFFYPLGYLKITLLRLQNHHEFSTFFLCGELYHFGDINDLNLTSFQVQARHKKFPKEHVLYSF